MGVKMRTWDAPSSSPHRGETSFGQQLRRIIDKRIGLDDCRIQSSESVQFLALISALPSKTGLLFEAKTTSLIESPA
jgi:hypothetical protein